MVGNARRPYYAAGRVGLHRNASLQHRQLAVAASARYRRTPHAADIRQVADIALWLAATRYDERKGAFERYAVVTIAGEIKKYLRQAGWSVRLGRQQEDALRLRAVVDGLTAQLRRTPTTFDVLEATGWTTDRLSTTLRCDAGRIATTAERHALPELSVIDRPPFVDVDVEVAVSGLPDLERTIVQLTYERELTQREIGAALSLTQSQVYRTLRRAHRRLAGVLAETE
ncbi:MAG: sigma-70 family RNA polymerase sigma factor [Ilumatobacteraceae bacterium]